MNLPSPAPSPSSKTKDLDPGSNSRKRQRSESSQSTTSSVKRSASEGPASTPIRTTTDDTTHTACVSDSDIDSYMMVQGEDDVCAMTLLGPAQPVAPVNLTPSEKFEYIKRFRCKSMQVGETWFLVSRQWYRRWEFACQGTMDKSGTVEEKDIGPVDNTPLVDQDGNLTSDLTEGVNVEFLPEDAWNAFTAWYGTPTHALPRSVISRGQFGQPSLELRPPRLRVLYLAETKSDQTDRPPEYVTLSTKDTVAQLSRQLVARLSARSDIPYRIWKIQPGEYEGVQFPAEKLLPSGAELLEISNKTLEESLIEFHDPFVVEFQKDGKWISDQLTSAAQPAVSEPAPLFCQGDDFFSRLASTSQQPAQQRQTPPPTTVTANTSFSKSKDTQITPFRPRVFSKTKVVQEPGTLGLANMGNTCFMNSALQCLAHTEQLANYFLSGVYQSELNPENPLGMQGAIAEAFGSLLHRIWAKDLSATTYSPREFKLQLQRFAPQFSGYQQHDSQELVAFLLDGLHEDLNRVRKKPYVEKPDWEGGGDLELAQLAQQSWQGYMRRNDSVIVDLFQGQYQSTLVCPECHKVSITFDPFMYLTLPIPIERKWSHTIRYVPWDPSKPHVEVPVEIVRGATFKDLRLLLGRWMGVPAENLLTMEVFGHRFYKNLDDTVQCDDMSENDVIFCYELPCNARQSRSYKAKNDDPFIVPVFLSDLHARPMTYGYRSHAAFGHPFFAVIDREDARTVDGIYSAVVDYLQRWSHNARDLYVWEEGQATLVDSAPIIVPPIDSLTEIKVNGDATEGMLIEDDITDAFGEQDAPPEGSVDIVLRKVGVKTTFDLRFQSGQKDYTASFGSYNSQRLETWDDRIEQMGEDVPLLKEWDALYCDFDRNMKTYFFGDEISHWEHSTWEAWDKFIHPEYAEAKRASLNKNSRVISIDDCLEEFTKEEKLGEDDLWYCPRCKKHQQAAKKFDLWKVPDILAVHLKRFSNSRTLRDKIDAFVDFPIEGFDLTRLVGEREVGKRLNESGANLQELGVHDLDEPLIYDLYAVDEHLGGLGGGHYRACAFNHVIGQWYHFDDSYVTRTEPMHAVNANAYLLFYKRRSNRPLGGKTLQKIEEAAQGSIEDDDITPAEQHQLPTPPEETSPPAFVTAQSGFCAPRSPGKATPGSSSPLDDLPTFDESQSDPLIQDSLLLDTGGLHASELEWSRIPSPTSSAATEGDDDYQKLSSPDESLNRGWDDNSPASAVTSDLSPSLRPMDG